MEILTLSEKDKMLLFDSALTKFGIRAQLTMVVEECAELLNVIAKLSRNRDNYDHLLEELADVHIMVEQISYFYGYEKMKNWEQIKLQRLKQRLENYGTHKVNFSPYRNGKFESH